MSSASGMKIGLPEGWTTTDPEIRTMIADSDSLITLNGADAGFVLALGYVVDENGKRRGLDMSGPTVLMAVPGGDPDPHGSTSPQAIAQLLRGIALAVEKDGTATKSEDRGNFKPGADRHVD